MKLYTIYENTITLAPMMSQQGTSLSLRPYRNHTHMGMVDNRDFDGYAVETEFVLELHSSVEVAQSNDTEWRVFTPRGGVYSEYEILTILNVKSLSADQWRSDYNGDTVGRIIPKPDGVKPTVGLAPIGAED